MEKKSPVYMRMILFVAIFLLISLSISGCKKESKLNETNTRTAKRVISTVDDYLEGNISTEEAREVMDEESVNVTEEEGTINSTYSTSLKVEIGRIGTSLDMISWGNENDNVANIKRDRNSIAEYIGEKKIK